MNAELFWYDDEVTGAKNKKGDVDASQLRDLLDKAVSAIEQSPGEMARIQSLISDLERYLGRPVDAFALPDLAVYDRLDQETDLKYNVCYSVVNTIVSRVCSFRPRAQFVPEHGNYKTQRLTRDLTSESDAWCQDVEYQAEASLAMRDSLSGPGGVLKIYLEDGQPDLGRFPAWELKLDEEDWKYGKGECSYHVRYVTLSQALRSYGDTPEARDAIATGASRLAAVDGYARYCNRDGRRMVRIVDAYKRGPKGRHVLMAGDHIAINAEWKHDGHPFVIFVWDRKAQGPWGHSAIAPIRSIQDRVDATLDKIDKAQHLASSLVVATAEGHPGDLTNEIVQHFKKLPGETVQFHTVQAVDPGTYHWFEILKTMAFEILGVSPNAAQATKPQGVTAAVAIEAVTDLQSDRLSQASQTWEQAVIKVGDWWYALSADEGVEPKEYVVTDRGRSRRVKFKGGERKPSIRTFPTSLFGQSVPARLQKAMDAVKAGWFEKEEILRILDVPDLGGITELQLAEFWFIEGFCDRILEDGKYDTIDEWASPIKAFEYARKRYLLARADQIYAESMGSKESYPDEHMALMRKFLDYLQPKAQEARDKAAGKAAPAPAPGAAPPAPGAPMPAGPQSLIPAPSPVVAPPLPGLTASPEANPLGM